jgi:hypothetical protein
MLTGHLRQHHPFNSLTFINTGRCWRSDIFIDRRKRPQTLVPVMQGERRALTGSSVTVNVDGSNIHECAAFSP